MGLTWVSRIGDDLACSLRARPSMLGCGCYLVFGRAGKLVDIRNHALRAGTCGVEVRGWLTRAATIHCGLVLNLSLVVI